MSSAIGGYFGLELSHSNNSNPHFSGSAVNSGRNALHCILQSLKPAKVLIPRLLCDVILEPFNKLGIPYEFYSINESFKPKEISLKHGTFLLYINYFGVCDSVVKELVNRYPSQIIIDNTQAYFSKPISGIPTFYSTRKFFGVPDGAYFYGVDYDLSTLPLDKSWDRCTHLLKRIDLSPEEGYSEFKKNDEFISTLKPERMSNLTNLILSSIDFDSARDQRAENYSYLHSKLKDRNKLGSILPEKCSPISYPFRTDDAIELRKYLTQNRIYTPIYWIGTGVPENSNSTEHSLSRDTIHLPIDHRYDSTSINYIVSLIQNYNTGTC